MPSFHLKWHLTFSQTLVDALYTWQDDFKCHVRNILTKINGRLLKWTSANVDLICALEISTWLASVERNPRVPRAHVFNRPRPPAAEVAVSVPTGVEIIHKCMHTHAKAWELVLVVIVGTFFLIHTRTNTNLSQASSDSCPTYVVAWEKTCTECVSTVLCFDDDMVLQEYHDSQNLNTKSID